MSTTLSKIEKRTAYTLLLPAVCLVFAIILFPIFANVWISFKEVGLKDIRIPEPRAKKIVKNIQDSNFELKIIYKLRNSSLIQDIREVRFSDKLPKNVEPVNLDKTFLRLLVFTRGVRFHDSFRFLEERLRSNRRIDFLGIELV